MSDKALDLMRDLKLENTALKAEVESLKAQLKKVDTPNKSYDSGDLEALITAAKQRRGEW